MKRRVAGALFLIAIFALSLTVSVGVTSRHESASQIPAAGRSNSPFVKRFAYLPREPRLIGVQPNSGFAQVGVASYGANGTTTSTNGVEGIAMVSSASIGYYSATIVNNSAVSTYSGSGDASIQENAVAFLSGGLGYFWTQNVAFVAQTGPGTFSLQLIDNIWNFNSITAKMSSSMVSGNGSVSCFTQSNVSSCFYYAVDPSNFTVSAPFTIALTMWIGQGNTNGATDVSFSYAINDSSGHTYSGTYDDAVLFPSNSKVSSNFIIGGDSPYSGVLPGGTHIVLPNDVEFVWGGPGDGSGVYMNSIAASEMLFVARGTSFVPAGDVYSVGSDTGEEASGITVSSDLSNPNLPSAALTSGYVDAIKLWPLPLSLDISSSSNVGSLEFQGSLAYSAQNISSAPAPASGLPLSINTPSSQGIVTTDSNGAFAYNFIPSASGIFHLIFSYPGSPSFLPQNASEQIAVSSITIPASSTGAAPAALLNATVVQPQIANGTWLLAEANDTSEVVTFQKTTSTGGERFVFVGLRPSGSTQAPVASVTLTNNASQVLDGVFLTQYNVTISNPQTFSLTSKWYNESEMISLSAPGAVTNSGQVYSFSGWDVNGRMLPSTATTQSVTVSSPMIITAEYTTSGQSLFSGSNLGILAGASALSLVLGLGIGLYARRSKSPAPPPP